MNEYLSLYESVENTASLEAAYNEFIHLLTENEFWLSGRSVDLRVNWENGRAVRKEDKESFSSTGLYIWGCEERPVYIGITTSSFNKRFSS